MTHVQIMPRMVPAPDTVLAKRAEVARSLETLGLIDDASAGQVNDRIQEGWIATINGGEVQVAGYGVEPDDESGATVLTLYVLADSVQIGGPGTAKAATPVHEVSKVARVWGPVGRDPREGIRGWTPESLGEQVARNAEISA